MGNSNKKDVKVTNNSPENILIKTPSFETLNTNDIFVSLENKVLYKELKNGKTCLKCGEKFDYVFGFVLSKCAHVFCPKCLCDYVEINILPKIKCPLSDCFEIINDSIVRKCLSNYQTELYENLCNDALATKCLIKDCSYCVVLEEKEGHFDCPNCKQPNCVTCSSLHVKGQQCGISPQKADFERSGAENLRIKNSENLKQLTKQSNLLFNPDKSNCQICDSFLIPRQGILIQNCMHNFCRECLVNSMTVNNNIFLFKCLICNVKLEDCECRELMGDKVMDALCLKAISPRFFNCQTPNCTYLWDPGEFKGSYKCSLCGKVNCIECYAIHEGQSCEEYKKSDKYKAFLEEKKVLAQNESVKCYNCCIDIVIAPKGCGAITCNNCFYHVCKFTGLKVGPDGCKCKSDKPCHAKCIEGCFIEKR